MKLNEKIVMKNKNKKIKIKMKKMKKKSINQLPVWNATIKTWFWCKFCSCGYRTILSFNNKSLYSIFTSCLVWGTRVWNIL